MEVDIIRIVIGFALGASTVIAYKCERYFAVCVNLLAIILLAFSTYG